MLPRRRTAQCGCTKQTLASTRQRILALLPRDLDTASAPSASDAQCTAVVSSRKSSRLGRAVVPSSPSTWMRQASGNAPWRRTGWCLFCDQTEQRGRQKHNNICGPAPDYLEFWAGLACKLLVRQPGQDFHRLRVQLIFASSDQKSLVL